GGGVGVGAAGWFVSAVSAVSAVSIMSPPGLFLRFSPVLSGSLRFSPVCRDDGYLHVIALLRQLWANSPVKAKPPRPPLDERVRAALAAQGIDPAQLTCADGS